jgi:hypothetical protein
MEVEKIKPFFRRSYAYKYGRGKVECFYCNWSVKEDKTRKVEEIFQVDFTALI